MSEFLVEVTPGREVVYPTAAALRAAIRSGEVSWESRIYHRTSARWVSITEHPEYRKFLAERRPADWLEPIPFEPVEAPPPARARLGAAWSSLLGMLRRARRAAGRFRPSAAAKASAPSSQSQQPAAGARREPGQRGWTFLP